MHTTIIKLKNGDRFEGPIERFRPKEGYLTLLGYNRALYFDDMVSAVTIGERVGVIRDEDGKIIGSKIEDVDELARAKDMLRENDNTPQIT